MTEEAAMAYTQAGPDENCSRLPKIDPSNTPKVRISISIRLSREELSLRAGRSKILLTFNFVRVIS